MQVVVFSLSALSSYKFEVAFYGYSDQKLKLVTTLFDIYFPVVFSSSIFIKVCLDSKRRGEIYGYI